MSTNFFLQTAFSVFPYIISKKRRTKRFSVNFYHVTRVKYHMHLYRKSLLFRYRHRYYLSCINKNFFVQTSLLRDRAKTFLMTTGRLPDFKRSTKKKKPKLRGKKFFVCLKKICVPCV